jgi:peptidoglycan hydrolase-like protein with peptidoglycan-binding domain
MNRIIPLKLSDQGPAVANLQDGLLLLLDKRVIQLSDADRKVTEGRLRVERTKSKYGQATRKLVGQFQEQHQLEPLGDVDKPTAKALNAALEELGALGETPPPSPPTPPDGEEPLPEFQHLVRGVVRYEKGLPIPGVKVEAFDIHLRRKDHLGDSITDADGLFEIFYSVEKMRKRGQQTASLHLQVVGKKDGERKKSVLTESDIIFEAGIVEKVVLRVPGGPKHTWSEYEQLMSEITPLLEDAPVSSLAEDDKRQELSYLSGKLGVDLKVLAQLAGAHKLAERTHMPPEVFFGLARKRLPFKLSALLSQSAERRRMALTAAVHELIVPGRLLEELDSSEARFNELAAEQAIDGLGKSQVRPWRAVLGGSVTVPAGFFEV